MIFLGIFDFHPGGENLAKIFFPDCVILRDKNYLKSALFKLAVVIQTSSSLHSTMSSLIDIYRTLTRCPNNEHKVGDVKTWQIPDRPLYVPKAGSPPEYRWMPRPSVPSTSWKIPTLSRDEHQAAIVLHKEKKINEICQDVSIGVTEVFLDRCMTSNIIRQPQIQRVLDKCNSIYPKSWDQVRRLLSYVCYSCH